MYEYNIMCPINQVPHIDIYPLALVYLSVSSFKMLCRKYDNALYALVPILSRLCRYGSNMYATLYSDLPKAHYLENIILH